MVSRLLCFRYLEPLRTYHYAYMFSYLKLIAMKVIGRFSSHTKRRDNYINFKQCVSTKPHLQGFFPNFFFFFSPIIDLLKKKDALKTKWYYNCKLNSKYYGKCFKTRFENNKS